MCQVDGCQSNPIAKGLCAKHYTRFQRYGSTDVVRKPRGEAVKFITDVAVPFSRDHCLTWPFTKTKGYGWVSWEGKSAYAHRVVCSIVHGAPRPGQVARHSCGNGHLACVNPKHLSWGSHQDNSDDCEAHGKRAKGERQGGSKLKEADVLFVIEQKGKMSANALAEKYSVHPQTIRKVWNGDRWGWISSKPYPGSCQG